ncbi:MAG: hypothetical protein Q8S21_04535 [Candidatus Paracaedibacteraceae bacterium]|nr:hypothetical protein [Candidatus Paracaedibacteraceae bacterium]
MPNNFQLVDLPGKGEFRVATTDAQNNDSFLSARSPEWMIKIDNITTSEIDGYTNYIELFGWQGESNCLSATPVSGGPNLASSTLRHTDLILIIPFGGHSAQIETKMNRCEYLDSIVITHIGAVLNNKVPLQTLEFNNCRIQRCQQQLDRMIVHVMISVKTNTVFVYDQTGLCTGQMVSKTDYIKNTAE